MSLTVEPRHQLPGIAHSQEDTRRGLAYASIGGLILLMSIIIVVGWFVQGKEVKDVLQVLTASTSILAGIVGAVVAFYFKK